mmetsp:Transcript_67980/g.208312  ORF Transcript_67980/g.208312 Transcript_67980/m.208312 type:complete len:244 (-) Transcript_67980:102-833(-)
MRPPFLSMRLLSSFKVGSWALINGNPLQVVPKAKATTHKLFPTWASVKVLALWSWMHTVAVVPDIWADNFPMRSDVVTKLWVFLNTSLIMLACSLVLKRVSLRMSLGRLSFTKLLTSWPFPPWPSKMAYNEWVSAVRMDQESWFSSHEPLRHVCPSPSAAGSSASPADCIARCPGVVRDSLLMLRARPPPTISMMLCSSRPLITARSSSFTSPATTPGPASPSTRPTKSLRRLPLTSTCLPPL